MTAQPVDTTTAPVDHGPLLRAAAAAAPLIPAPHPLGDPTVGGPAPAAGTPAFAATFTGTASGEVVLVLDATVVTALGDPAVGVQVEDAVRPALEAAAEALGPCVLGPVRAATAEEVTGGDLAVLAGGDGPLAWIAVTARASAPAPAAPAASAASLLSDAGLGLQLLRNVELTLSVEIGRARMTVRDLLQLTPGSVIELDRAAGAPADLLVNGRLIARGEVVVVDEDYGLRITELIDPAGDAGV